jgi:hypothetical protein
MADDKHNEELTPAERVREGSNTSSAEAREKALEAEQAARRVKDAITPAERVRENRQESPGTPGAAAGEEQAAAHKKAAGQDARAREKTVTPAERVDKSKEAVREDPRQDTPEAAREAEDVGPRKRKRHEPLEDASMTGLPGFSGKMPGED